MGCAANMPRSYSGCIMPSTQFELTPADGSHQLRAVALHQVSVAAVVVLEELHAVLRGLHGEIGHVNGNRLGQIDLFLDLRVVALRNLSVEQESRHPLVILETYAAV